MTLESWQPAPKTVELAPRQIHVWAAEIHRKPGEVADLAATLIDEEREQAERRKEGPIRNEWIVSRGLLRTILSRYLPYQPREFRFAQEASGKPYLTGITPQLHYNVTHSAGMALVALTCLGPVGVDVEQNRPFKNELGIAKRYFLPREYEGLAAIDPEHRRLAFFRLWTGKESFVKACGIGMANGVERVELSVSATETPRVLFFDGQEDEARLWSLHSLTPNPDYIGALAHRGHDFELVRWHFQ